MLCDEEPAKTEAAFQVIAVATRHVSGRRLAPQLDLDALRDVRRNTQQVPQKGEANPLEPGGRRPDARKKPIRARIAARVEAPQLILRAIPVVLKVPGRHTERNFGVQLTDQRPDAGLRLGGRLRPGQPNLVGAVRQVPRGVQQHNQPLRGDAGHRALPVGDLQRTPGAPEHIEGVLRVYLDAREPHVYVQLAQLTVEPVGGVMHQATALQRRDLLPPVTAQA